MLEHSKEFCHGCRVNGCSKKASHVVLVIHTADEPIVLGIWVRCELLWVCWVPRQRNLSLCNTEVCKHEAPLVMSPVFQGVGWRIVLT